jgi:carboxylesterase type B
MLLFKSLLSLYVLASLSITGVIASPPQLAQTNTTNPIVKLDYITLQGTASSAYNLTYYRRIPFGASTAGPNRFRAPQPPTPVTNGTYNTDRSFDMCPQRTVNGSEDCLYLGVYSRPWAAKQPLRPVLLTLYGGGFIRGNAAFDMPPSGFPVLNVSETNGYVVVYANYRTNVFGFLPGRQMKGREDVDLNVGLLDQQAALKWIQKYIHHFGGDRRAVTIWGQSAGGGSVVAQSIAGGNRGKGLFKRAMSSSPFWPKTYRYDSPESEALFDQVVEDVGCAGQKDEVACLKKADLQALRDSALRLSTSLQYTTSSFTWGPVIDGKFLTESLSDVVRKGKLNTDTVLTSYNLHEGENFVPPGFQNITAGTDGFNSSQASFDSWLRGFLPGLGYRDIREIKRVYPSVGEAENLKWNSTYVRAGMVFRDLVLACPAYWLSKKADKGWLVDYTISPAQHASDTIYVSIATSSARSIANLKQWNQVNPVQKSDAVTYQGYAGAMASFVQTGDPNAHKVTNASIVGAPRLSEGKHLLITEEGLEVGEVEMLGKRCAFWLGVAEKVPV